MAYEKNTWQNGDLITEQKLNHIEQGVKNINNSYEKTLWKKYDVITAERLNNIEDGIENAEKRYVFEGDVSFTYMPAQGYTPQRWVSRPVDSSTPFPISADNFDVNSTYLVEVTYEGEKVPFYDYATSEVTLIAANGSKSDSTEMATLTFARSGYYAPANPNQWSNMLLTVMVNPNDRNTKMAGINLNIAGTHITNLPKQTVILHVKITKVSIQS